MHQENGPGETTTPGDPIVPEPPVPDDHDHEEETPAGIEDTEDTTAIDATPPETPPEALTDIERVRAFAASAYPDVVPELIGGATVADILASVDVARAAYRRVAERVAAAPPTVPPAVRHDLPAAPPPRPVETVPAGGATPFALDPDHLPPDEKIRRGLNRQGAPSRE